MINLNDQNIAKTLYDYFVDADPTQFVPWMCFAAELPEECGELTFQFDSFGDGTGFLVSDAGYRVSETNPYERWHATEPFGIMLYDLACANYYRFFGCYPNNISWCEEACNDTEIEHEHMMKQWKKKLLISNLELIKDLWV